MGSSSHRPAESGDRYERDVAEVTHEAGRVFFARAGGYLLGFGGNALFARLLGVEAYGLFSLGMALVAAGTVLSMFGTATGIPRFMGALLGQRNRKSAAALAQSSLVGSLAIALCLCTVIALLKTSIAVELIREPDLAPVLPWFGAVLVLQTAGQALHAVFQGVGRPSSAFLVRQVVQRSTQIGVFLVCFVGGMGFESLLLATVLALTAAAVALVWRLHRLAPWVFQRPSAATFAVPTGFVGFSATMLFVAAVGFTLEHANKLLLAFFLGSAEVAQYAIAFSISSLCVFVLQSFNSVFSVRIAELHHAGNKDSVERLYATVTRWVTALTLPLAAWLVVFSEDILALFGEAFVEAAPALRLLVLGQTVNACSGPSGFVLTMTQYHRSELAIAATAATLSIALNLFLIPGMRVQGAALAGCICLCVANGLRLIQVRRSLGIHPYTRAFLRPAAAGIAALGAAYACHGIGAGWWSALMGGFAAAVSMLVVMLALGLEKDDRELYALLRRRLAGVSRAREGRRDGDNPAGRAGRRGEPLEDDAPKEDST